MRPACRPWHAAGGEHMHADLLGTLGNHICQRDQHALRAVVNDCHLEPHEAAAGLALAVAGLGSYLPSALCDHVGSRD